MKSREGSQLREQFVRSREEAARMLRLEQQVQRDAPIDKGGWTVTDQGADEPGMLCFIPL
jgi:hypothetical protein